MLVIGALTPTEVTLDDVVWSYEEPLAEMSPIAGLLSFYDERVTLEIED